MRTLVPAAVLCAALAVAGRAEAQFANHSIGVSGGYLNYGGVPEVQSSPGISLGLDYSLYFENGFDFYARTLFGFYTHQKRSPLMALGGGLGIRYLFAEESFQPYFGLSFNYATFAIGDPVLYGSVFSFSPHLGFQYFLNADFSFGITAEYDLFLVFGAGPFHGGGVLGRVATHF